MSPQLLQEIGLNPSQARVYLALIEKGALTPPAAADAAQENRTNAYMVLEQLAALGLAEKVEEAKKLTYQATNPINLEKVSEKRRRAVMDAETRVKQAMPTLLSYYYSFTEKPGVRYFEGKEGILNVFEDMLRTKQPLRIIRSPNASLTAITKSENSRTNFITKRIKLGITAEAITPTPTTNAAKDAAQLYTRHFIGTDAYTAPVEINIYGNKVALISFGEEVIGTIIESKQIAEAFGQIFTQLTRLRAE
jgi:HTH-type transcriptional regulator, sugar sensing transcriptional regulator